MKEKEAEVAKEPGGGGGDGDGREGERRISLEKEREERKRSCHKPSADTTQPYAGNTRIHISFSIPWIRYPAGYKIQYLAITGHSAGWISYIRPSINAGYTVAG